MTFGVLWGASTAWAAAPPAKTNIGNTASATFTDAAGRSNVVTSNPVVTVVQQVGAFALDGVTGASNTVINTKSVTAGGTVYSPHVLTNTGNGQDSFNIAVEASGGSLARIEVFPDDGSGNPMGAALCTSSGSTSCSVSTPVTAAGSNGVFKFVIAYTVPGSASGIANPFATSTVTATPITASASMYTTATATVRDLVNLTTGPAFTVTKRIGVPSVAAAGGGAWPAAASNGKASKSSTCATTWSVGLVSNSTCQYTVYTLTLANTGVGTGRFALGDTLPSGLTYVTGSAVWSNAPGIALTDAAAGDSAGIDYRYSAGKITAVIEGVPSNATQTLSFVVLVNGTATAGTATTTNVAYYNPAEAAPTATSISPGSLPTPTGTTPYTVYGSYGVVLGAASSTSGSAVDAVAGTPNATTADNTTVASATAGTIVKFEQRIFNIGDTVDTVNLTVNAGSFPSGTTFFLFGADGATPLQDTGAQDGVLDTGPIQAGSQATVVVAAFLPVGLTAGSVNYAAVLTGTSKGDPSKIDGTRDLITSISRGLVDVTNSASGNGISGTSANGDSGPGPSPSPTTTNTTVGGSATAFNLYISNNDSTPRTYSLAASSSTVFPGNLPYNWAVKFVAGADGSCLPATPAITTTSAVPSNGQIAVTACVTPPAGQAPVNAVKIYFRATATAATPDGIFASDTKTDAVTVTASAAERYSATLTGSNSGELTSPGTVVYSHILSNIGTETCGPYNLQVSFPSADADAGWTYAIYLDTDKNGQIGSADQLVTGQITTPLLAGASNAQYILIRIGAPAGLSAGATTTATVRAVFAAPNSCGSPFVTDLTTIHKGTVRVYKAQAVDAMCDGVADGAFGTAVLNIRPGNCIYYHVTAMNEGVAAVVNLTVKDRVPAYTTLSTTQPTIQCSADNARGSAPTYAAAGAEITCGNSANVINPGGSVTLDYSVRVDQ
ncbi:hypothetical protein [Xylophilus sp. GOD-11R]|uniref:beta strand repeat-containing protein n=1 Tax=Xylophilus sp. GOD-11R TaxID=3089814 RepID=UPI00298BE6D4|nr:hypothetical protein [Xylophilus sp. GOD-11R]WPB58029.1 hypothetical protein R9X41_05145 [Xylophilus sp. GOD-11R]